MITLPQEGTLRQVFGQHLSWSRRCDKMHNIGLPRTFISVVHLPQNEWAKENLEKVRLQVIAEGAQWSNYHPELKPQNVDSNAESRTEL
jgi:hypothetical protein